MRKYAARRSAQQWRELVQAWERSELTGKAFAERNGVKLSTLRWWRSRLRREHGGDQSPQSMRLLPVRAVQDGVGCPEAGSTSSGGVVLRLPGDVLLQMSEAPSAQWLARLCIELEMP